MSKNIKISEKLNPFIRNPVKWSKKKDLEFQIVDWYAEDTGKYVEPEDDTDICEDPRRYTIYVFGVTKEGYSVCAEIKGFEPFFFVKVPDEWTNMEVDRLSNFINKNDYRKDRKYKSRDPETGTSYRHPYRNSLTQDPLLIKRLDLNAGFTNEKLFKFVSLQFKNQTASRKVSNLIFNAFNGEDEQSNKEYVEHFGGELELYESNIDPMLRFMHLKEVLSSGWIRLPAKKYELHRAGKLTFCQIEAEIFWKDIVSLKEKDDIAPIRQASFDIECISVDGKFPVPDVDGNECIQIATAIKDYGDKDFIIKHIFTLKKSEEIEGAIVVNCKDEKDLLLRWAKFIQTIDPDVLIGYNIFGFDLNYVMVRAKKCKCLEAFCLLSKFRNYKCQVKESALKSNAYGDNHFMMVAMPGRFQIDLLQVIKRAKKYESYTLKFVSTDILGETKDDLTPPQLFECWRDGSVPSITRIAKYCIQDTLLPQKIMDKMNIFVELIEMAKVTWVPLEYLINRGQQIKVFSQVAKTARENNYLVPHLRKSKFVDEDDEEEEEDGYEGATVLSPLIGSYWDGVAALDFKALYPTTEIDWNLCYTTLVKDDKKYGNLDGVRYNMVEIVLQKGKTSIELIIFEANDQLTVQTKYYPKKELPKLKTIDGYESVKTESEEEWKWRARYPLEKLPEVQRIFPSGMIKKEYKWAQDKQGLVPYILINLLNARDRAKKQMAEAEDAFMKSVYNGKQLALKVSCNSVYGFTGAEKAGMLPCKPIAECTTTIGRGMIDNSKKYAEDANHFAELFMCDQYYPLNFPYIVELFDKKKGKDVHFIVTADKLLKMFKVSLDDLDDDMLPVDNKGEIKVWTTEKFQPVTGFGKTIDQYAGEDRTLIKCFTASGEFYKIDKYSCEVIYGDSVTGESPLLVRNETNGMIHIVEIQNLTRLIDNENWEDYNGFKPDNCNRREKQRVDIEKWNIWTDQGWKKIKRVIRHKVNKKLYGVSTRNGYVEVTEDHSLLTDKIEKIKPLEVELEKTKLLTSFPTEFQSIKPIVFKENQDLAEKSETKLCSMCKIYISVNDFYTDNGRPDKLRSRCKMCDKHKRNLKNGKKEEYVSWKKYSQSYELTEDEAWVWGLFMADGSCGSYKSKYGTKYSWAINNQDIDRLNRTAEKLSIIEPKMNFKRLETMDSSGVYKLVPVGDITKFLVTKYRRYMYNYGKCKVVPSIVLNAPVNIRKAFFEGYYEGDGCKTTEYRTWGSKNQVTSQSLFYLAKSIGYDNIYMYRDNNVDKNVYHMSEGRKRMHNQSVVRKIVELDSTNGKDNFVYDIETEIGRFHCGVGEIVVLNTDSIFTNFDTTMFKETCHKVGYSMIVGAYVSEKITDFLRSFNPFKDEKDKWSELEYEKVYANLVLFTKKRYTGTLHEFNPLAYEYIDKKGIALKRRDYCHLVKDIYKDCLKVLFDEHYGSPIERREKACEVVIDYVKRLLNNEISFEKLVLSKSLRDTYKIREKKKKKSSKEASFHEGNIFIDDVVEIHHPVLGITEGKVIVKQELEMDNFFKSRKKKVKALQMKINKCQFPDKLSKYNKMKTKGFPFSYNDIILKKGFDITLDKIIDPNTTEAELEAVTQAHVRLTRRIYQRDPGNAPKSGERVPYVFIKNKNPNVLQHEKAEHPDFVRENNLQPDPLYYLENQVRKPIEQLFELLMEDPTVLFDPYIRDYKNKESGQMNISSFVTMTTKTKDNKKRKSDNDKITAKKKEVKKKRNAKDPNQMSLASFFGK